jgi:23S rRNA (cytosine1962-C5)-methyltransferase
MLKVFLNKNEEKRLLRGHPWVFNNEVNRFEGEIKAGCICDVYSYDSRFIGRGFFNSNSKIMVRLVSRNQVEIDEEFFRDLIKKAWKYRQSLKVEGSCRVIFSEADNLPGLIVDKYGDYLSIQILSLGIELRKEMIIKLLIEIIQPKGIYERSDVSVRKKEGLEEFKGIIYGDFNPIVEIEENGIKMYVDLENGQKTGYFLDQKYNRKNLENYCENRIVLDCFSHTGGFALHASKYKAKQVVAVDISQKAVEDITKNAKLNGFENIEAVQYDVFDYLRLEENKNRFDCIVLDPPAFTKSKDTVEKAYRGYKDINLQALKIIKEGGFLLTFSCSQHMTPALFLQMLEDAVVDSKRQVRLVDFRIQSPDHPTMLGSDESLYLKCAVLHII